ncbi:hypothetical protein OHA74_14220 [Streptomyces phaeochromogenes]|uniref:hypothetical protein n=1 Tax=Streptomyces phaeochromogenes TaxID=1923 RepID=UPI002E296B6E|nr:hypothetical protein [Streptomyces phaeochromogenes]
MYAVNARRARRWFWTLLTVAVLAMGALYQGLRATPGAGTGLLVAISALVLVASAVQAARILTTLTGPPRFPRQRRPGREVPAAESRPHGRKPT